MIRQTTGWVTRDATVDEGVRPPEAGAQVQILREHHVWPANITASRLLFALIYWGGIHPLLSIAGVTARDASGSSSLVKAGSTGHPGTRVTAWNEAIDLAPGPQRHLLNTLGAVVVQGFVQ
jgi:hypothetical protein